MACDAKKWPRNFLNSSLFPFKFTFLTFALCEEAEQEFYNLPGNFIYLLTKVALSESARVKISPLSFKWWHLQSALSG